MKNKKFLALLVSGLIYSGVTMAEGPSACFQNWLNNNQSYLKEQNVFYTVTWESRPQQDHYTLVSNKRFCQYSLFNPTELGKRVMEAAKACNAQTQTAAEDFCVTMGVFANRN